MKIIKARGFFIITTFLSILFVVVFATTGCAPKVTETVDVRQGATMDVQVQKGATVYKGLIPAFVLDGTSRYILNISATFKITNIIDTRTLWATSTSLVQLTGASSKLQVSRKISSQPVKVVIYLCTPLSSKAIKASDGSIIFTGVGYPDIIEGHDYIISGILQPKWQSVPLVYVASGYNIKNIAKDEVFFYAPEEQFKQDADSLSAKKTVKDFLSYWNAKNLIEMEKLLSSKKQGVDWELARTDYVKLIDISEFYTEEANTKTFVAVFDFKYKKDMGGSMNGGITYWNFILKRENNNSPWLIQDWGGGGNTY